MEASDTEPVLASAYDIAPTGDTILVVGKKETRLRVHSLCLRTASTVFDAMFGPHFLEGQTSDGVLPKVIPMPDDDARALITICSVIHHRNDIFPDVLQPTDLADVALAADKYDCVLALKYAMYQWLDFKDRSTFAGTFASLGNLLIAAYVFDNSNAFQRTTQRLITGFSHSYHWLIKGKCDDLIPWSIYRKCIPFLVKSFLLLTMLLESLETVRTRTRLGIQDVLLTEMVDCCHHPNNKHHAQETIGQVFRSYSAFWGARLFKMSIQDALDEARGMVYPGSRLNHEGGAACKYDQEQAMLDRYSKLQELDESAGLCLRCVRSGNTDADFPCNLSH